MRLIVAAGGGGDAVAAAMLHAALYGRDPAPAVILTYSWDRLLIDPAPGPRSPADFDGLRRLTPHTWAVPAAASARAPYGSTLPRLAADLPHTVALIDPTGGAVGITRQLNELVAHYRPDTVDLVDVGGDILARGDEPTLRSPLADALTLAACASADAAVRLFVAGPGLDGELSADSLRERLGPPRCVFTSRHVAAIAPVLRWHPSEATALLAATACGARGRCEVRDAGLLVPLTDEGPQLFEPGLATAFEANRLATAVASTDSLSEAERISRQVCGFSEIDYERSKAARMSRTAPSCPTDDTLRQAVREFEAEAVSRGATHATVRRIAETLQLRGAARDRLWELLAAAAAPTPTPSLWRLPPHTHQLNEPPR